MYSNHFITFIHFINYLLNRFIFTLQNLYTKLFCTLYAKFNKIISTFSHCTIDVKLLLIKSYCTSFYCGYMWSDYKKITYSKLRVAFNNVHRRVLRLSYRSSFSTMYTTHNINNMEALINIQLY